MVLKPIVMPKSIEIDKETASDKFTRFIISPLERGYGVTIGNAMRRVLLSSIQGAAITNIRISNVTHEFSTIPGVIEDVVEIILNLKQIRVKLFGNEPATLVLKVKGKKEYRAEDIEKNPLVIIVNPEQKILSVTDTKVNFTMEMMVEVGRGYVSADLLKKSNMPVGTIYMDAIFSPVLSVNFDVRNTRVGTKTDYDHLVLEVKTDGTKTPIECVAEASSILRHHFKFFVEMGEIQPIIQLDEATKKMVDEIRNNINKIGLQLYIEPLLTSREQLDAEHRKIRDILKRSIDELEISVRTSNCLKNKNIKTIGDLVRKSGKELLTYDNFGRKSLKELEKILHGMGLRLEMDVDRYLKEDV